MGKDRLFQLNISLSKEHRDRLRTMAAQRTLDNPVNVVSAAQIGREIIGAYLDQLEDFVP